MAFQDNRSVEQHRDDGLSWTCIVIYLPCEEQILTVVRRCLSLLDALGPFIGIDKPVNLKSFLFQLIVLLVIIALNIALNDVNGWRAKLVGNLREELMIQRNLIPVLHIAFELATNT